MQNIQVDKTHYDFNKYVNLKRWNSYYYQISETLKCKGKNVLLIGAGDNIVVQVLKDFGKEVTVLDFDEKLNPDIVGSVTELDKLLNKKYDIIVCCQVLEHIPHEEFDNIIKLISEYTNEKFILSLPNRRIHWKINVVLPLLNEKNIIISPKIFNKRNWDIKKDGFGEHYWEIDALKQWKRKNIEKTLKKYFDLEKSYVVKENPYHIFFILNKKK